MTTPLSPDPGTALWSVHARGAEWTAVVRLSPGAQQLLILYNGAEFSSQMFQEGAALLEAARVTRDALEVGTTPSASGPPSPAPFTATASTRRNEHAMNLRPTKAHDDVVIVRRAGLDIRIWRLHDEYAVLYPENDTNGEPYRSLDDAKVRGRELAKARQVTLWYDYNTDDVQVVASFRHEVR